MTPINLRHLKAVKCKVAVTESILDITSNPLMLTVPMSDIVDHLELGEHGVQGLLFYKGL